VSVKIAISGSCLLPEILQEKKAFSLVAKNPPRKESLSTLANVQEVPVTTAISSSLSHYCSRKEKPFSLTNGPSDSVWPTPPPLGNENWSGA
jgi:hypothetical protein